MASPLPAMRRLTFLLSCTWLTRRSTEGFSQCSSVIALFHPCIITRCRYPAVSGQGLIIRLNLGQQVSPVFLHLHSCLTHSSAAQVPACTVSTSLRVRKSVTVKSLRNPLLPLFRNFVSYTCAADWQSLSLAGMEIYGGVVGWKHDPCTVQLQGTTLLQYCAHSGARPIITSIVSDPTHSK